MSQQTSSVEQPNTRITLPVRTFGQTSRTGAWWLVPLVTFLGLGGFVVYSTWAAFVGTHYRFGPYLSPMYSPELWGSSEAWFGPKPSWWPSWMIFSPALLILWAPGGFRMTCYYYRGAYYKAFWADPPSCAVGEPRKTYWGEASFPLIIQNIHRYFLYLALLFIILLAGDFIKSLWYQGHLGIGVGSIVMLVNVCLLASYTFGCHSLRHLIGGGRDKISSKPLSFKAYNCVTCFNQRHMMFAWFSLLWVAFTDIYVRLCSMHIWHDYNTWGIH